MKKYIYLLLAALSVSCARLPTQTLDLTDAVLQESKRMHDLNIQLINSLFKEKRNSIDQFIRNEYTPKYLKEFQNKIPSGTDYKAEFPSMVQSIIPVINARRDSMQAALERQRVKLVTQLHSDYETFQSVSMELRNLIESGIKVDESRKEAFEKAKGLTGGMVDLNKLETVLDNFVNKSGTAGNILNNINELNNSVDGLLKK